MSLTNIVKNKGAAQATPPPPAEAPDIPSASPVNAVTIQSSGLLSIINSADSGGGLVFPTLTVTGGSSGGMLAPHKSLTPDISNRMPQGKMPVDGVFIGLRTEVSAWPTGYDDRDPDGDQVPSWSVAISAQDNKNAGLVEQACRQYQFTPKPSKKIFDFSASQVGHIRPSLQILCWSKTLGDIMVIQSPPSYESWLEGLRGVMRMADKDTGALAQFPMSLHVKSLPRSSKSGQSWMIHVFGVDVAPNADGVANMAAFKAWRAGLPEEKITEVNAWLGALDRQMTPEITVALTKAKTLRA